MDSSSKLLQEAVNDVIRHVEDKKGVRVLFASDVGSRVLGWSSPHSDIDVHLIYVYPMHYYLSIQSQPRSIEVSEERIIDGTNIEVNIIGWDLQHSLVLLSKSNPAIVEMLSSPGLYRCESMCQPLVKLCDQEASRRTLAISTFRKTRENFHKYLHKQSTVRLKVYLYMLYHLLYILRLESSSNQLPRCSLSDLLSIEKPNPKVMLIIDYLLEKKRKHNDNQQQEIMVPRYLNLEIYLAVLMKRAKNVAYNRLSKSKVNLPDLDNVMFTVFPDLSAPSPEQWKSQSSNKLNSRFG
eukprot:gb/GECH01007516.1/.p1 GENE.gb/GECH01007516.1/~~gb/GECH01007516.1/.p1  ORF type:complete len:295 (+),score=43.06 gb/GECH01007516.1/:1-885(+)